MMPGEISRSYQGPKDGRVPSWMDDPSPPTLQPSIEYRNALDFIGWVMETFETVDAECGTPRDEKMQEFARCGMLKFHFCAHGTNTYLITSGWLKVLR
jgi:hypothetical protein